MKKLSNTESELKKCCLYKKECISFNFLVTEIRVAVSLAEDETKTGGIQFQLSPSNLIKNMIILTKILVTMKSFTPPFFDYFRLSLNRKYV